MSTILLDRGTRGPSVRIDGERIVDVGAALRVASHDLRLDCTDAEAEIRAGDVNAHTHLYSGLAPLGMPAPEPPPESFVQILERVWWRLDRALDETSLRAAARLYIAESLRCGTTTLVDHHESPNLIEGSLDVLADAAQELGIRLLVCYGATERNGGLAEARRGLAECRRFIEQNRRPLVTGVVGLHASFTCSDDAIREAGALARELDTVMHVHMAEDGADVDDARRRGYTDPLHRLLSLDALPPGSILAHGVHLDEQAVARADDAGCWLVQNPRSNEGNQVGYPLALGASGRVAIGTDGYPANMREERDALERLARAHGDEHVLARDGISERVMGGFRLAEERFGYSLPASPQAGGVADLRVEGDHGHIRHVVVGGRVVVRDGTLTHGDMEQIRAEAQVQASELWSRMARLVADS